jgi:hypothetical protein
MSLRRRFTAAAFLAATSFAPLSCSDSSGPTLPLKDIKTLELQLDTIDAGLSTPQLKSFSAGTPANVLQVTLYQLDNSGLPAPSKVEIGYAYLEFLNEHNGGRSDSAMMRFTLFTVPHPGGSVVADWVVWRLPADTACGQCATITAGIIPTTPGGRYIYLTIPYRIPLGSDGSFSGSSYGGGLGFAHTATLPGPASTGATAGWAFSWQGDSVSTASGPLHPTRSSPGVLGRLFAVPADIADYIEWPTFVIFFCGC